MGPIHRGTQRFTTTVQELETCPGNIRNCNKSGCLGPHGSCSVQPLANQDFSVCTEKQKGKIHSRFQDRCKKTPHRLKRVFGNICLPVVEIGDHDALQKWNVSWCSPSREGMGHNVKKSDLCLNSSYFYSEKKYLLKVDWLSDKIFFVASTPHVSVLWLMPRWVAVPGEEQSSGLYHLPLFCFTGRLFNLLQ